MPKTISRKNVFKYFQKQMNYVYILSIFFCKKKSNVITYKKMNKLQSETKVNTGNILDQLVSYKSENMNALLLTLRDTLEEQKQVNSVLNQETYDDDIVSIRTFLEDNSEDIERQESELKSICEELKSLINENKTLAVEENELKQLLDSDECKDIADRLANMKILKYDIYTFLEEHGIMQK